MASDQPFESDQPFPETAQALLRLRNVSQRELARRCQRHGWGGSSTVNAYVSGRIPPSLNAIERIAYALEVRPEIFAEYRLGMARRLLDPGQVGFEAAVKSLARFDRD